MARRIALSSFAAVLGLTWVNMSGRGLWEDGYFVKRFAYNFWHGLGFSWNAVEGPLYGMTSQTLQLVAAAIYPLAPNHLVLSLKAALWLSLLLTPFMLARLRTLDGTASAAVLPLVAGLSCPLLNELLPSGLETPLALLTLALALVAVTRFASNTTRAPALVGALVLVYATRPDAVLIPLLYWSALAVTGPRAELLRHARALAAFALAMAALLLCFRLYYGTALPLPFYVKTHGFNVWEPAHIALFAKEKQKNALQFVFWCLPFIYIALHRRERQVYALLGAAAVFALYHYTASIETMAHHSRFYMPALVPVIAAAGLAFSDFQAKRRLTLTVLLCAVYAAAFALLLWLDERTRIDIFLPEARRLFVPVFVAIAALLLASPRRTALTAALVAGALLAGTLYNYRWPKDFALEDDEAILLRQIRPRLVFRGLEQLRDRIDPQAVFHTDLGAPGVLLPRARVVDINGLLNREMALKGIHFEALCLRERPEAIYVPNTSYPVYRKEILGGACLKQYTAVTPMDGSPLHIRNDLLTKYTGDAHD